ncbi:MAG: hypothetical protein HW412_2367, partial [Bacteroidetes bacterium]|nr:hypothetical protein [Bacteroidota bacterium]
MYSELNTPLNSEDIVRQSVATYPVRRGRIFFALLLTAVLCAPAYAQKVEALTQTLQAKPGTIMTTGIRVTNTSAGRLTFEPELHLPRGWRPIARESPFGLDPQQSD